MQQAPRGLRRKAKQSPNVLPGGCRFGLTGPRLPENPADTKNTRVAKPATVDFLILPDATLYFAAILMLLSSRVRFPQQWAAVLWHIRSLAGKQQG